MLLANNFRSEAPQITAIQGVDPLIHYRCRSAVLQRQLGKHIVAKC